MNNVNSWSYTETVEKYIMQDTWKQSDNAKNQKESNIGAQIDNDDTDGEPYRQPSFVQR